MNLFKVENIAFEVLNYPISYIEFIATLFGLISVWYASRANILTWSTGIINEFFLFILFFQIQLYADMLLQVYFFAVTIFGWYFWKRKDTKGVISISSKNARLCLLGLILAGTWLAGLFFKNIHLYLPALFKEAAAYPYADSFVMITSIVATVLLAKKKLETWYLWIAVNLVCIVLFYKKAVFFLSLEYLIFLLMALYGLYHWKNRLKYA